MLTVICAASEVARNGEIEMNYEETTQNELTNGYHFDKAKSAYICNYCGHEFPMGQVFPMDENYYEPEYAVVKHIDIEHGGNFSQLLKSDTKYNTLTDNQKELLTLFQSEMSDNDIAKELGISASTVRHQKFTFREKAKQAKHYLAVYDNVFSKKKQQQDKDSIVPIHDNAKYYDERYVITEKEKEKIIKTTFENISPLKLKLFPAKDKKKVVVLTKIAEQFEKGRDYTEKEINDILMPIYDEYIIIRRYLIEYGFIDRKTDGSKYWLK